MVMLPVDLFYRPVHPPESNEEQQDREGEFLLFNAATEMYCYGMFLYELFVGRTSLFTLLDLTLLQGELELGVSASDKSPIIPEDVWTLIRECTRRDPTQRPKVADVITRLENSKSMVTSCCISLTVVSKSPNLCMISPKQSWPQIPIVNTLYLR